MRTVDPARHAARRARILEAAAGVFAAHGFDGATTAAVCRAAGIGSGTLFHYFPDKRALFTALFAEDLERLPEVLAALDRTDPLAALLALVEHRAADAGDPVVPGLLVAAIVQAGRDPDFAALLAADDAAVRAALADLLRAATARGQVDPGLDADLAASWVVSLVDALYFRAGEPGFDVDRERAVLRVLVLRFLRAGEPGAQPA